MISCEICGTENITGTVYCDNCGADLPNNAFVATETEESSSMMELPFVSQESVSLFHQRSGETITLPEKEEIIIGREDPISGVFPDIDTSALGGEEDGVSRRHAKIVKLDDKYYAEDLDSVNSTYLNKEKLAPGEPVELNDDDELMLGRLKFTVKMS